MALVHFVLALALLEYLAFGYAVARARGTYKVAAPATTGHEVFERYFRVQMNTLEQLVLFLPALWMAVSVVAAPWLGALGALYLIGRFLYLRAYVADPPRRELGFALTAIAVLVLLAIDLVGAVRVLLGR
jgi:glutathione S-transferase